MDAIHRADRTERQMEEEISHPHNVLDELKTCGIAYNDNAVRQMIECIRVYLDGKLEVIFGGGYTINEQVEMLK